MNASPYFRYYAAFVLIMVLALLLRVQAHATPAARQTRAVAVVVPVNGSSSQAWRR